MTMYFDTQEQAEKEAEEMSRWTDVEVLEHTVKTHEGDVVFFYIACNLGILQVVEVMK